MADSTHLYDTTFSVVANGPDGKNAPSKLTAIDLPVRRTDWCDELYDVKPLHPKFTAIRKTLPDKFNNPSIFCAQKELYHINE
jgi:hypothetical protein